MFHGSKYPLFFVRQKLLEFKPETFRKNQQEKHHTLFTCSAQIYFSEAWEMENFFGTFSSVSRSLHKHQLDKRTSHHLHPFQAASSQRCQKIHQNYPHPAEMTGVLQGYPPGN